MDDNLRVAAAMDGTESSSSLPDRLLTKAEILEQKIALMESKKQLGHSASDGASSADRFQQAAREPFDTLPMSQKKGLNRFQQAARKVLQEVGIVSRWQKVVDDSRVAPAVPPQKATKFRRKSMPGLEIAVNSRVPGKGPRRVTFCSNSGNSVEEAFTPYGKKYGAKPEDFYFNEDGLMVLEASDDKKDVMAVKVGDMIECTSDEVQYHTKPMPFCGFEDSKAVVLGQQITIQARRGTWVQDDVGWLQLLTADRSGPAFQTVTPKEKLRFAVPRVPVMGKAAKVQDVP